MHIVSLSDGPVKKRGYLRLYRDYAYNESRSCGCVCFCEGVRERENEAYRSKHNKRATFFVIQLFLIALSY